MAVKVWFVYWSEREETMEGNWTDWKNNGDPWKIFFSHEDAVDYIVKRVAKACDKMNGSVIRHDVCSSDGWFYYKWEEIIDGITKQHTMQIEGDGRYVE